MVMEKDMIVMIVGDLGMEGVTVTIAGEEAMMMTPWMMIGETGAMAATRMAGSIPGAGVAQANLARTAAAGVVALESLARTVDLESLARTVDGVVDLESLARTEEEVVMVKLMW